MNHSSLDGDDGGGQILLTLSFMLQNHDNGTTKHSLVPKKRTRRKKNSNAILIPLLKGNELTILGWLRAFVGTTRGALVRGLTNGARAMIPNSVAAAIVFDGGNDGRWWQRWSAGGSNGWQDG